ncbi:MAG: DUF58 domain-containing protein [Ardenticatenia bacterium]|nr:DUF58 domain-containing protein [Ardenticatenia bacterium]
MSAIDNAGSATIDDEGPLLEEATLRRLERLSLSVRSVSDAVGGRPGIRRVPAADFIDHRPYSPGDDRRHIDWHAAARHDGILVKVGRVPQAADVHLLIDRSPSVSAWPAKWRQLRRVAAALGWMALSGGDRLAAHAFPALDPRREGWSQAVGAGQARRWLAWLSTLRGAPSRRTLLSPAIRDLQSRSGPGGLLVILTDAWLDEDIDRVLAVRQGRWNLLLCTVLDRSEWDPEWSGPVMLQDSESGLTMELDLNPADQTAYRQQLLRRYEQIAALARSRGHIHVLITSDTPLETALVPYLQLQAALRR